jgi:hypothetical protein
MKFYRPGHRFSRDVDANLLDHADVESELARLQPLFSDACAQVGEESRIRLSPIAFERRPPMGHDQGWDAVAVKLGYAYPGDRFYSQPSDPGNTSRLTMDISLSEGILEGEERSPVRTGDNQPPPQRVRLKTYSLEAIVGEKLRAILQQPLRKRMRSRDLFDIITLGVEELEFERIRHYFELACRARAVTPDPHDLWADDIERRLRDGWPALVVTVSNPMPFDQAWTQFQELVRRVFALRS